MHLQIIERANSQSHAQDEECEALETLPTKEIDRAQSAPQKAFTRLFFSLPTKALTSASTMMSMAASAPCELVLRGTWYVAVLAARLPMPDDPRATARAAFSQHACGIDLQAAHGCLCY